MRKQNHHDRVADAVKAWNEKCPVGTEVAIAADVGPPIRARTRSYAWIREGLGLGATGLVNLEGRVQAFRLDRLTVINSEPTETEPGEAGSPTGRVPGRAREGQS
jgi:hypothetical protein